MEETTLSDQSSPNNQNKILEQIQPCDPGQPYLFVSYSSHDAETVYRDVLELQNRGYNVWLDEKNLDKTKSSWKEDALDAISFYGDCMVLFYISSYSLTSLPCLNELLETKSEETRLNHFRRNVPYICIDTNASNRNIQDLGDLIEMEIRYSNLPLVEKQARTRVLTRFMDDIFNSNNERIRLHSKNETGRLTDYYKDIMSSLPPETRCMPEKDADADGEEVTVPGSLQQEREIPEVPAGEQVPEKPRYHLWIVDNGTVTEQTLCGRMTFGRPSKRGNPDIMVAEAFVSRAHGVFTETDAGIVYKDVGSTNGTWIGARKAEPEAEYLLADPAVLAVFDGEPADGTPSVVLLVAKDAADTKVPELLTKLRNGEVIEALRQTEN